ncbi:MAG TPA: hypothetical protein VN640_10195 [Sphingomicrobium sp.]|jgi:hypothetical protein|nr:hypothetical protein [Sphingomicrobium sp.]
MNVRFALPGRLLAGVAVAAAANTLPIVPSSAQVRLYSPSEDALTTELATQLDAAHAAQTAAFDAHRAYLVEALGRERKLLVERELAERDAFLTIVLKSRTPAAELSDQIDAEWTEVSGSRPTPGSLRKFRDAADDLALAEIEQRGVRRQRAIAIALFEAKGGKGKYCNERGEGNTTFETLADSGEAAGVRTVCKDLAGVTKQVANAYELAGSSSALLGDPHGSARGTLDIARQEAKEIDTLIEAQDALSATVAAQVKSLDRYYQCELGRTSIAGEIRADAAAVQQALDTLAKGDPNSVFAPGTFTAVWKTLTTNKIDPDCTKPPAPHADADDSEGAANGRGISAADILTALGKLDRLAAGDALLAAVRDSALEVQGSALNQALTGLAAAPGASVEGTTARRAQAALRIFGNLDTLYRARAGTLPDTAGVLVALADVRMRQATAKIEADRLAELGRLSKLRLVALRQRAIGLAEAKGELAKGDEAAWARALRRYNDSWNNGAIPATVIENDMSKARYLPWLDRERAVVDAGYAILAPAVVQLQAYGKGGIKPETIAQFLQVIGLGSIAVSK